MKKQDLDLELAYYLRRCAKSRQAVGLAKQRIVNAGDRLRLGAVLHFLDLFLDFLSTFRVERFLVWTKFLQ